MYLSGIIRKGDSEEVRLACRVLSLALLTLGSESESFGKLFLSQLATLIKNTSKPIASRIACIQALGTIHFILSPPEDVLESMSLFEQLFLDPKTDPMVSAEAVELWTILASTVKTLELGTSFYRKYMPTFTKLLETKDLEVRFASGEAIALLYSASLDAEECEVEEIENQKGTYEPDITALISQLQTLATESSKRFAKKDKVKQRSLFRDIVSTVESGTRPKEKMTIGKRKIEVVGWSKLKQLAHVREILGTGFSLHFSQNDLMTEIFQLDCEEEEPEPVKKDKKAIRAQRQEKEKTVDLAIGKQRKKKKMLSSTRYCVRNRKFTVRHMNIHSPLFFLYSH